MASARGLRRVMTMASANQWFVRIVLAAALIVTALIAVAGYRAIYERDGALWVLLAAEVVVLLSAYFAVERDLRARRRAAERVAAARLYAESIVDTVREPLLVLDAALRVLSANRAFYRTFAVSPAETEGRFVDELGGGMWNSPTLRRRLGDLLSRDAPFDGFEVTHEVPPLGARTMLLNAHTLAGAEPVQILLAIEDITEPHRAEVALHESEQRLQLMVEAANIGLWDWEIGSDQIYHSPQWKAQLGYDDDELDSHPREWEDRLHPDDRDACVRRLRNALRGTGKPYEDEFRLRHRAGSYRWIASRGAVLRDAAGRARRMFGAHVDITRRRAAEDAVRQLNAELEQRVAERTAQLAAANRELEAFSYSVSHDLRAPLRAIDGFAHALVEEYGDTLPAAAQHYLDRVRAGAGRMSDLIDDLLTLARVTRSEMRQQDVDLSTVAAEVAAELRQRGPQRTVEFAIEPGHVVRGDPVLLRLALENLLDNAWKYTGKRPSAHVAFGALAGNGERVFFVRDDGAGFDPTYADKLFGPFQRLHGPDEFEGTGVGLATVQRIVHRHGGRVWAEGAIEAGATFYFTL